VLLTFRGPSAMKFELAYFPGGISVWRPADCQVWAATSKDQAPQQIGGFARNPAPGLDSRAPKLDLPIAVWDCLPLPEM
jgi:hypothetical protein